MHLLPTGRKCIKLFNQWKYRDSARSQPIDNWQKLTPDMMEHKYVSSTWNQTPQMDIKHKDFSDVMVVCFPLFANHPD